MKFSDILLEKNIICELRARDKKGVLEELAEVIVADRPAVNKNALVRVLVERERLGSTGIGDGVAIPHGKLDAVQEPVVSVGRSTAGLDFDSMDGQPTHLFFLLVAPEKRSGSHLQALAKIARILKSTAFRRELMAATTPAEIYDLICSTDDDE